ncbi:MAG: ATP-dependent DNA helicase RecG [Proteobacteria bacterium]|nr:ATP-dependent DNA helicase RecG [Pseudomonadota bacterium]
MAVNSSKTPDPVKSGKTHHSMSNPLAKLGLSRRSDLILHLPLRYEDETKIQPILEIQPNRSVQIQGTIYKSYIQAKPKRMLICHLRDDEGEIILRFLHFYGSQVKQLIPGVKLRAYGEARLGFLGIEMIHPRYRLIKGESSLPQNLTPIYPTVAGLSQSSLRKLIDSVLSDSNLSDTLPSDLILKLGLPGFSESIMTLHHPPADISLAELESGQHPAWRRIKFDELLAQQLSMRLHYERRRNHDAPVMNPKGHLVETLLAHLPFPLTQAQKRAMQQIRQDITQGHPMQRLLQGDVGCGKTLVAFMACLDAIESGYQAALMAPTELLAEQHYLKAKNWLEPLGIRIVSLFAAKNPRERETSLTDIKNGHANLVIGTHALIQETVDFSGLGLAIIDEQHRFGVEQRLKLRRKGRHPHQLMLSATPIPRTLSMSYYADLDVSVIDELPPGRTPVLTRLINTSRRNEVMQRVEAACASGRQAYWVCPLIEDSDLLELQAAIKTHAELSTHFPHLNVGLIHGKKSPKEKTDIMAAFVSGQIHLLVATTVIEVGVDVPNASLMIIDHAERMGLAQLHQLRGRVGRGKTQSACVLLFQPPLSDQARARLQIIAEHSDGFEIAQQDLRLRGPGEYLGARQSGTPLLKFANIEQDLDLLEQARNLSSLILNDRETVQKHLDRWLGQAADFLLA